MGGLASASCQDTDNGLVGRVGTGCSFYTGLNIIDCGRYDGGNFTARTMCCNCGGGHRFQQCSNSDNGKTDRAGRGCTSYNAQGFIDCGRYDTSDFKAAEMCCICGGGSRR